MSSQAGFLVIPVEIAAPTAVARTCLLCAALDAVICPVVRLVDIEAVAEIVEPGLRTDPLGERVAHRQR